MSSFPQIETTPRVDNPGAKLLLEFWPCGLKQVRSELAKSPETTAADIYFKLLTLGRTKSISVS
jgi:hypothetical protein